MADKLELPPIIVVSMENAKIRRDSISRQFTELGFKYSFHNAVIGKKLPKTLVRKYSQWKAFFRGGRTLNNGEIGCFASHYQIWEHMIENAIDEMLILEDDIIINSVFFQIISNRIACPGGYQLLNITNNLAAPVDLYTIQNNEQFSWCSFDGKINTTSAYLLRLDGAKLLLEHADYFWCPVDDYINYMKNHNLIIKGITPSPLDHARFESSIWKDPKEYERHKRISYKYHHYWQRIVSVWNKTFSIFKK